MQRGGRRFIPSGLELRPSKSTRSGLDGHFPTWIHSSGYYGPFSKSIGAKNQKQFSGWIVSGVNESEKCVISNTINLLHIWWGLFSTWQLFKTIIQVKVTLRIRPPLSPQTASLQESSVCLGRAAVRGGGAVTVATDPRPGRPPSSHIRHHL